MVKKLFYIFAKSNISGEKYRKKPINWWPAKQFSEVFSLAHRYPCCYSYWYHLEEMEIDSTKTPIKYDGKYRFWNMHKFYIDYHSSLNKGWNAKYVTIRKYPILKVDCKVPRDFPQRDQYLKFYNSLGDFDQL